MTVRQPSVRQDGDGAVCGGMPLDRTMTYRLHLLHKLSDRQSHLAYVRDVGLPLSECRCLSSIGAFAPLSIKDLARSANLNKGQASRAAQSLVDQGLVEKVPSGTDGRGVVLTLTPGGTEIWERLMRVIARRNEEIFGCLSSAERKQLGSLFDRLIAHARAEECTDANADGKALQAME